MILNEMVHDARIIPLDGRPRLPSHLRQWLGDGRGRWEGDTLVETTNFTDKTASFNPGGRPRGRHACDAALDRTISSSGRRHAVLRVHG